MAQAYTNLLPVPARQGLEVIPTLYQSYTNFNPRDILASYEPKINIGIWTQYEDQAYMETIQKYP
jgi:hypothetical protein